LLPDEEPPFVLPPLDVSPAEAPSSLSSDEPLSLSPHATPSALAMATIATATQTGRRIERSIPDNLGDARI
jgi:hypothetical protein